MLWKFLFIGFLWGSAVSVGNYYYLQWVVKKNENRPPREKILSVVNCYIMRYFINIAALLIIFLVCRNIWAIAAAGIGLTVMKNVTALRELQKGRKGSQKAPTKSRYSELFYSREDDDF